MSVPIRVADQPRWSEQKSQGASIKPARRSTWPGLAQRVVGNRPRFVIALKRQAIQKVWSLRPPELRPGDIE